MKDDNSSHAYWKATLSLLTKILMIWFLVCFGAGILFADLLNNIKLGGYPLGFWFAHQGGAIHRADPGLHNSGGVHFAATHR